MITETLRRKDIYHIVFLSAISTKGELLGHVDVSFESLFIVYSAFEVFCSLPLDCSLLGRVVDSKKIWNEITRRQRSTSVS